VARFPDLLEWDGVSWHAGPQDLVGEPRALLSDGTALAAVGPFTIGAWFAPPFRGFEAARWDGQEWTVLAPWNARMHGLAGFWGGPAHVQALTVLGGKLAAGGVIDFAGTGSDWRPMESVALWDGSDWEAVPFGPGPGYSYGWPQALLGENDTLYAAGEFRYYPGPQPASVLRYANGSWTPLDTLPAHGTSLLRYGGDLFLGASIAGVPGPEIAGVLRWNGSAWESVGSTSGADQFHGVDHLAEYHGLLIAGGSFIAIDDIAANGVAAWDGRKWRNLGGPGPAPAFYRPDVRGIAIYRDQLVIAGAFAGDSLATPLMVWDGLGWRSIPGIHGEASSLCVVHGTLFLGGRLTLTGGEPLGVARWDGSSWQALGSGVNGWTLAFQDYGGALWLGGDFSRAGVNSSFGIARWSGPMSSPPSSAVLSAGRPNPFRGATDFSYHLERAGPVRVSVYDIAGREVSVLENATQGAGDYVTRWDGRDREGRDAPAGVYFVQIRSNVRTAARKIVRLR
jgi:trimeric autotransporter adhesin